MDEFFQDYPLSLKECLLTPCIESFILQHFGVPCDWPTQKSLKHFALRFGFGDAAMRTCFSRANKQGEMLTYKDHEGTKRIKLGPLMQQYTSYFLSDPFEGNHFSLILFHFSTSEHKKRYALKEMLSNLNYVMLTQNAYLRYGNRPEGVDHLLTQQGFDQHIYHFTQIDHLPQRLHAEIPTLFQTENWKIKLDRYQARLQQVLNQEDPQSEWGYLRYLYIRAAFHKNILAAAPFLPEEVFPEIRTVKACFQQLIGMTQTHMPVYAEHFQQFFVATPAK